MLDRFKVNNEDVSRIIAKALTAEGFDIEIVPGFVLGGVLGEPVPQGDIITAYRKAVL